MIIFSKLVLAAKKVNPSRIGEDFAIFALLLGLATVLTAGDATAAINLPFIDGIGCDVFKWLTGPLAVLVFIIVFACGLLAGLFTRMDWAHIITVVVIFGLIQGIVSMFVSSGYLRIPPQCM